jgi:hypothetical protein
MDKRNKQDPRASEINDEIDVSRREALAKLAKYSAYTAPTVVTLLAARPSMAQGLSPDACQELGVTTNANPNNSAAVNPDASSVDDTPADCGV